VAYYVRAQEGWAAVVLFDTRPSVGAQQASLFADIDAGLWNARSQVYNWPAGDQFSNYPEAMRKTPGFVDPRAPDR
jgi:hypothetical protein